MASAVTASANVLSVSFRQLLDEGGFGTIMASWIQEGDDVSAGLAIGCAIRAAMPGSSTRASRMPCNAAGWNREQAVDERRYSAAIDRWLDYFNAEDIAAFAYGAILLRRRDVVASTNVGPNWIRNRQLPNEPRSQPADHLLRLFTGTDFAIAATNDALLDEHLALAPGAR